MEFKLRPWTLDDLDSLVLHADNPRIAQFMTNKFINPYSADQGKRFIAFANKSDPVRILAIDVDGEAVGAIGIHPQDDVHCKNAELGYWLSEAYWGKGIMTQAIRQMVDYGFQHWELTRIFAVPYGTNIGSQKALEKVGFKLEAHLKETIFKNGVFLDELIYAVRRD